MSRIKPETGENLHRGNPDFNVEQARIYLGYGTKESVYLKARQGSANGGFDAYIFVNENGAYGWKKKIGVGHTSMNIMFYKSDLDEWANLHPSRDRAKVEYTEKEISEVLALAESLKNPDGTVTRQAVYNALIDESDWAKKHSNYSKMAQILDDHNIPGKNLAKASRAGLNQGRHKKTALAS